MKKIVGIIAALALAGSVFARPDITPVITEFKGDATLEWIANLDGNTYGFSNGTGSSFKIQMRSDDWGGDSTSGEGWWGEVTVRTGGGYTAEAGKTDPANDELYKVPGGGSITKDFYGWGLAKPEVSTAKIHFIDGDTYLNVDILKPDFKVGEIGYILAVRDPDWHNWEDYKFEKVGGFDYNGFTVNFGIPIVDLTLAFGDDGAKSFDEGHYGFKFAATLKPIDGLNIYAGIAKNTEENSDLALAFTAGYNYKINDQFYIKPAVQFDMVGDAKNLGAAVFFGWGAEGQCWNHDFLRLNNGLEFAWNQNRCADGLSVLFTKNLADQGAAELRIDAYDNKLLNDFDIGTFTWGLSYRATESYAAGNKVTELGKGKLSFALIYNNNFDIFYLTARASFGMNLALDNDNTAVKYGLRFGTKELIANTDVYADYVASFSKYAGCDNNNKGTITLGTKISF